MKFFSFLLLLLLCVLLPPALVHAQSFEQIRAAYPEGQTTTVTSQSAYVYADPDLSSRVVGRYNQGRELFAYGPVGDFYAVATPGQGHAGYVLLTDLDVPQTEGAAVAPTRSDAFRDPATAQTLSYAIPGGGHLYAGEMATGATLLGGAVAGIGVGYALAERSREVVCSIEDGCITEINRTPLYVGTALAAGAWLYSVLDAKKAARRANARLGVTAQLRPFSMRTPGSAQFGLAMRVTW